MGITIKDAIKQLLQIVQQLHETYPQKKFTLDGRLVGDLGEILVQDAYDIVLSKGLQKHHDGVTSDGKNVQIKSTMKDILTFPVDHTPDYYLGIKVYPDGSFKEIFNGPGSIAREAVKNRQPTKTNLHSVNIDTFLRLNSAIKPEDKIPLRNKNE